MLVTEPSVSGLHDLERVYELTKKFHLPSGCIINKADINPEVVGKIKTFLQKENITHLADLPYDETFTKAMTFGKTIIESGESEIKNTLQQIWKKINNLLTDEREKS